MTAFAKSFFIVAAVALGMLAALACGKPKGEAVSTTATSAAVLSLASCDTVREQGSCSDYSSSTGSFGVERSLCRTAHGDFRLAACPTQGRIGSCIVGLGQTGETKQYYGGEHGFTAETARADCAQNGRDPLEARFLTAR
ncbi:MAG: hypothetical protein K0S65_6053 [Labilithrix sp.]|nr:hypothetical protein [Labilithrix sp.]